MADPRDPNDSCVCIFGHWYGYLQNNTGPLNVINREQKQVSSSKPQGFYKGKLI